MRANGVQGTQLWRAQPFVSGGYGSVRTWFFGPKSELSVPRTCDLRGKRLPSHLRGARKKFIDSLVRYPSERAILQFLQYAVGLCWPCDFPARGYDNAFCVTKRVERLSNSRRNQYLSNFHHLAQLTLTQ
jgi:hypothetical protein